MAAEADDRQIERERYDQRAAAVLAQGTLDELGPDGPDGIPLLLRAPYAAYAAHIAACTRPGVRVLDLCCGNGQHSLLAARQGASVAVSDLAPHNVSLALARARRAGLVLEGVVADAEHTPWPAGSFDVITCAGSLSYVDLERFLAEVRRLLRPGGVFIFVDSLNHNPVYRFNRYWHYRRGRRSRSTLLRMPTQATLARIRRDFPDLHLSYHGTFSFAAPLLRLGGEARAARWIDTLDAALPGLRRFAFKVVGCGRRPPT